MATIPKKHKGDDRLFELHPLRESKPVVEFMCFNTPEAGVFLKCEWNSQERRFNKNCRRATAAECQGGA
jgi:hypothetical protein